jgi:predicted DNA-binding transcriptional regulator AlpA
MGTITPIRTRSRARLRDQHAAILARLTAAGMPDDALISKDELAALTGCSTRTVDRLLAAGNGPARVEIMLGKPRFLLRDAREWIAYRKVAHANVPRREQSPVARRP